MITVKVCRVNDIQTARLCGELGVQLIGCHAIDGLDRRHERIFAAISNEVRQYYPQTAPVLVTKIVDGKVLARMLSKTGIKHLQVHVPLTSEKADNLLREITLSLGKRPVFIATLAADDPDIEARALDLQVVADYFLIDTSYLGGTGQRADIQTVKRIMEKTEPTTTLIAGGLAPENIGQVLEDLHPGGVDVQSGLELQRPGKPKDPLRLIRFVAACTGSDTKSLLGRCLGSRRRRLVSLALTAVSDQDIDAVIGRFALTDVDLMHFDFSDASVAPLFSAQPVHAVSRLAYLCPCMPYDVHLFASDPSRQNVYIRQCLNENPLLRVALLHCTGFNAFTTGHTEEFVAMCTEFGVFPGIALQATGFSVPELRSSLAKLASHGLLEVSLITHSRSHDLSIIAEHDLKLLMTLTSKFSTSYGPIISVDRDMTLKKLRVLTAAAPNHLVVGASLLASQRPQITISAFRRLLQVPNFDPLVRR